MNPDEKRCSKCKGIWPKAAFGSCMTSRDGLQGWCLRCHRAYGRMHRAAVKKARESHAA